MAQTDSVNKPGCQHEFKRVQNESGPDGQWVMVCVKDGCNETKYVKPPQQNESKDQKPLLME